MKTRTFFLAAIVFSLSAATPSPVFAQSSQERMIKRMPIEKNEPLEITDIKVNGQSVSFDKKFEAGDDWMLTLAFTVKNKSDKRILFANLDLFFTRAPGSKEPFAMFDLLSYGKYALTRRPPISGEQLIGLAPGETVEIGFTAQKFVDLTRFLSDTGFPRSMEKVEFRLGSVLFEDDTMWSRSEYFRRDPRDPSTWRNVNP